MLTSFGLILPVFVMIALGYWLKHSEFMPEGFWKPAEKLVYYICLPALIIDSLATETLDWAVLAPVALVSLVTIFTMSLLVTLLRPVLGAPGPSFASIHQASIRLNGFVGIGTLIALMGAPALPFIALIIAVWIPTSNTLSVYMYVRHREGARMDPLKIAIEVAKNPNIFSVAVGLVLNFLGAGPLIEAFPLFKIAGQATLPIGLLAVGAGLDIMAARRTGLHVFVGCAVKLIVMPLVVIGLCRVLEVDPVATAAVVVFAALPTSPGGYILANQLGGDARLIASIITVQHFFALITLTLFATWAMQGI